MIFISLLLKPACSCYGYVLARIYSSIIQINLFEGNKVKTFGNKVKRLL